MNIQMSHVVGKCSRRERIIMILSNLVAYTLGGNLQYKGIYRCATGMVYTFNASEYMNIFNGMNGIIFTSKVYINGASFSSQSIQIGQISTLLTKVRISIWYMNRVCFSLKVSIWMG